MKQAYIIGCFCLFFLNIMILAQLPAESIVRARGLVSHYDMQVMAYYFPQFHPFEENNRFWEDGFTEWTLLRKYQGEIKHPHADVGYYSMLDFQTRKRQAQMAKEHGISAFCYYHYWFKDKKVMYAGIEKIFEDGEPNIPFAFCWANETWARYWDGDQNEILLKQEYGDKADWIAHYQYLVNFFKHGNYIKENNCPIIFIYKMHDIKKDLATQMFGLWRKMAQKDGFDGIKIMAIDYERNGFKADGIAEHQPGCNFGKNANFLRPMAYGNNALVDQKELFQEIVKSKKTCPNYYYGITYSFDNASRRLHKPCCTIINLSYDLFEDLILGTIMKIAQDPIHGTNFIMLNAWNEWTEQSMIEPNDHDGYELLNIIKKFFGK